ncbi:MAG TPA: metal-sensitive transcriptional regulator [Armatimonadota bacterium]|jgi:DNA-binding FrmR family transcriptional regulator
MTDREKTRQDLLTRLRRIEGQVRGLQRMIEEDEDCSSVITQLTAVRGALDKTGFIILSHRMADCLREKSDEGETSEEALEEAMKLFLKLA